MWVMDGMEVNIEVKCVVSFIIELVCVDYEWLYCVFLFNRSMVVSFWFVFILYVFCFNSIKFEVVVEVI